MHPFVFDSSALLRFSDNEAGADRVREILEMAWHGKVKIYMSPVNWGEVVYSFLKGKRSKAMLPNLRKSLLVIFPSIGEIEAEQAAEFKDQWQLRYTDSFSAALRNHLSASISRRSAAGST